MAEPNVRSVSNSRAASDRGEGATTAGQFVFLILLVPVTVAILTGPLLGATIASLAMLDTGLLFLGFDP